MSLPTAQLGQLPSMNLGNYIPRAAPIEPAWHKALSAFLVNAAAGSAEKMAGNAFSRDYTPQAVEAGVAPKGQQEPSFWNRLVEGPQWTQKSLHDAETEKIAQTHQHTMEKMEAERLGLSKNEFDALKQQRGEEMAFRQKEADRLGAQHDSDAARIVAYQNANLELENQRLGITRDQFKNSLTGQELDAKTRAEQLKHLVNENDPNWAGKVRAASIKELMESMGIGGQTLGVPQGSSQQVPRGSTGSTYDQLKALKSSGTPNTPPTPADILKQREQDNVKPPEVNSSQFDGLPPSAESFIPSSGLDPDALKRAAMLVAMLKQQQGGNPALNG